MHAQGLEHAQDFAAAAAGQRGQCEQDAVDAVVLDERRQVFRRKDLDAVDHPAMQALVVIDEHQRIECARGRQHGRQSRAGIAGTIDRDSSHRRLNITGEQVIAHHEARPRDIEQRDAGVDRHHAPGERGT